MPRLIDYFIVVGNKQPNLDYPQAPEMLRRFPSEFHDDFQLPIDVVFFCQPEGCVSASKRLSLKDTNSFVFTLTEKDSGKMRYGICCNFFRPCIGQKVSVNAANMPSEEYQNDNRYDSDLDKTRNSCTLRSVSCRSLTSICIISENPFFSTFRECLFVLRKLIESRNSEPLSLEKISKCWNVVTEGNNVMKCIPSPNLRNWLMFLDPENYKTHPQINEIYEIEQWILRLLMVPMPSAGLNRIEVELLPRHIQPPLTFAFPERSRFSLLDFPLHLPLELLGVETCLKVLTCILLEQKVILQSDDYNALSISVMALTSMLYPLEYMFPVIPLLPTCMKNAEQLLLAPTPYVIGIPTSFLQHKSQFFQVPPDVLIVDLDTSKMCVPLSMDEIPSFPEPEGSILKEQLKQCIDCLSLYPRSMPEMEDYTDNGSVTSRRTSVSGSKLTEIIYGNDIDSVDVAIRASLVRFFTSSNVVGDFPQHSRILRLYPRPVVAFEKESFVITRPVSSDFIRALAETQAMEYFGEWLVNPNNTVYRKVYSGILDPRIIGDKPRWYSHYLDPIYFQVHNPLSNLGHDLGEDSDDSGPLFEDDDEFSDSDISLNGVEELSRNQFERESITCNDDDVTQAKERIAEMYDSPSPSYNVLEHEYRIDDCDQVVNAHPALTAQSSVFKRTAHRQERTSSLIDESNLLPTTLQSIVDPKKTPTDETNGNKPSKVENGERFFKRNSFARTSNLGQKAKDVFSRQGSNASDRFNALIDQIKPKLSQKSSVESQISVTSFVSSGSSECNSVPNSPMASRSLSQPQPLTEIDESNPVRWSNPEKFLERPSFTGQRSAKDPRIHNSENQQVINDVVAGVLKGDGVGWFSQKKLKRLLIYESLRQYLFKQLYEPKDQNEDDEAIVNIHISKNVYRSIVELLRFVIEGCEHNLQNKGAGGLASIFMLLEVMHTHYCGKRIQDAGANTRKTSTAKRRDKVDSSAQLSLGLDARSDSSIVYTREASPIPSSDDRVSSIFNHHGDHNENSITRINGNSNGSTSNAANGSSPSPASNAKEPLHAKRDSRDAVFDDNRRFSLTRQNASQNNSVDDDREGLDTIKRFPSLNHSNLISRSSSASVKSTGDVSSIGSTKDDAFEDRNLVCKSNMCNGYRFRDGRVHEAKKERVSKGISGTGRRFVFEGLMNPRSQIWDSLDFWEYCFYDTVAAEREVVGMDIGPVELLERYKSLGACERKCLEEDEDRLLASILHNMVAFMLVVQVDTVKIKRKIRRLLGKAHIGLIYTQHINYLLDNIEKLAGNDIDLKPLRSRTMKKHVFVVHLGDDHSGPVFFLEVCDDCMLIKGTNGGIVERWWYENLVNMSCSPRARILCLWIKSGEQTELQKITTKKCKTLYTSIKQSMEKTARKFKGLEPGMELGGEFDVVDAHTNLKGLLRVSLDGLSIIFIDRKCTIDVRNLKNCSRKEETLYIQEYVPHTQQIIQHELFSRKAGDICYSVLCLFSYLAAANNNNQNEARGSEGASSI